MRRVIFDSSFLMAVAEHPTTWYEDMTAMLGKFQPVILDCVEKELERLSSRQGKKGRLAALALELGIGFPVEPCGGAKVDDEIASAALSDGAAVATVDGELSKTMKALGIRVIGLRSGRVCTT